MPVLTLNVRRTFSFNILRCDTSLLCSDLLPCSETDGLTVRSPGSLTLVVR